MRILVVEDEQKVARFLERGLKEESYAVDVAHDGEEALYLAQVNDYDLIVLDILLPKKDGMQVLAELRAENSTARVLMLTAKDGVRDRVRGLDTGADDYLTKPFAFEEFLARVRAMLRRGPVAAGGAKLQVADLVMHLNSRQVLRGDKQISLTAKEYALLEYFMRHPNQVITRTQIGEHVWDQNFDPFTNVIDVYVHYLRDKIDKGFAERLIHTVRGIGYVLRAEPTE